MRKKFSEVTNSSEKNTLPNREDEPAAVRWRNSTVRGPARRT